MKDHRAAPNVALLPRHPNFACRCNMGCLESQPESRGIQCVPNLPYFKGMSLRTLFQEDGFPYLALRIVDDEYVTKDQLKRAKAVHRGEPVPEIIRHYEERLGRGEIKRPGRNKAGLWLLFKTTIARLKYPALLRRLKWRLRHGGLKGWSAMKGKSWWEGPPHEIAAKMIQARYFKHCNWRHVLNLVHQDQYRR